MLEEVAAVLFHLLRMSITDVNSSSRLLITINVNGNGKRHNNIDHSLTLSSWVACNPAIDLLIFEPDASSH